MCSELPSYIYQSINHSDILQRYYFGSVYSPQSTSVPWKLQKRPASDSYPIHSSVLNLPIREINRRPYCSKPGFHNTASTSIYFRGQEGLRVLYPLVSPD